jgi:hypothetical protein
MMKKIKINNRILKIIYKSDNPLTCLRIYILIYLQSPYNNKNKYYEKYDFAEIPRILFKRISSDYKKYIDYLVKNRVIEYRRNKRNDGFNDYYTKHYSTIYHICMSYRIIEDLDRGNTFFIEHKTKNKKNYYNLVYTKINNSLKLIGKEGVSVVRDKFGRRIYWEGINEYKILFKDAGYSMIDSKGCHISLLYKWCQDNNIIIDEKIKDIFEKCKDFYEETASILKISRDECKKRVMLWLNSKKSDFGFKKIYPIISRVIENMKKYNYKSLSKKLQLWESKIFIDDFIKNSPIDFALPVHDGIIVKNKDVDFMMRWMKEKTPFLNFSIKKL